MKKTIIILFAMLFSLISCKEILDSANSFGKEELKVEDLKTIKVNEEYSISIPKYMKEMKSLNEEASFEYANIYKEIYTIVLDESKKEFIEAFKEIEIYNDSLSPLDNYSDYQIKSLQENIEALETKTIDFKIKNLPSKQYELKGNIDNINAAYLIGFIESKERIYMIMSWTIDNRYTKYKNTFKQIQNSFKLIK